MFKKYPPEIEVQYLAIALEIAAISLAEVTGSSKEAVLKEIAEGTIKVLNETRRSPPLPEATE